MPRFLICIYFLLAPQTSFSHSLFDVDNMLPKEEIDRIMTEKDFFGRKRYQEKGSPIEVKELTYSKFFYETRNQILTYDKTLDLTLKKSFAVGLNLQNYMQAKFDQHIAIGGVLPGMRLVIGESLPISPKTLFTGIFNFLLPQQWIKLGQSSIKYRISKLALLKTSMDAYLDAKIIFFDTHKLILEFEILSFFYVHFRLMERFRILQGTKIEDLSFLRMSTYSMALRMASLASNIELKFNELAKTINQIVDDIDRYESSHIRIEVLSDFMDFVSEVEDFGEQYSCQENFVRKAIEHSLEIMMVKKLAKISKMNIGVIAIGDILNITQNESVSPDIGINLGYTNIPRILKSNAEKRAAEINVGAEFLKFVDQARIFHTSYVNASRIYQESMRSLKYSRENFYKILSPLIDDKSIPVDGQLLFASTYIVESEVTHNRGLHDALKSKAQMDRLLLKDKLKVQNYLPSNIDIDKAIASIHNEEESTYKKRAYSSYIKGLHRVRDLEQFLSGKGKFPEDSLEQNKKTVPQLVQEHMREFLCPKKRGRKFFRTLQKYIEKNNLELSSIQQDEINHYQIYSKFTRFFKRPRFPKPHLGPLGSLP